MDAVKRGPWECGSCGSFIDARIVEPGDPYHEPDADCRSVHIWKTCSVCEKEVEDARMLDSSGRCDECRP